MWEGGKPHQLDPKTLETIGQDNLDSLLEPNLPFSAHPKIIDNTFINFGKEGKIYLEAICSDSFPKIKQAELDFTQVNFDEIPKGELWQFEVNLSEKKVTREKIAERGCEFPSLHPLWVGKENRYLYMNVTYSAKENGPLQAVMKLDKKLGSKQIWSATPREFAGEPVFVPRPHGVEEDDGWILSMVYDAALHKSYLVILDAKDITQEIAKLYLKHHVPYGFHGTWTPQVF